MRVRTSLAAVAAAALYASPALAQAPDQMIASDQTVALESNTTREIAMPIKGLGQDWNVLVPCFGFSISGPGVDLAGANLEGFGPAIPEDASRPDGGIPGAQRQPDGSFVVPESAAVLTPEVLRLGANCRSVGWDFYGADGEPVLDPYGNPKAAKAPATAAAARKQKAASKRKRDSARRLMGRKIVGRTAAQGPVSVTLAGITSRSGRLEMVVRVTTGALAGPTAVSMHARVLKQSDATPR
jgi:hypothetical protein